MWRGNFLDTVVAAVKEELERRKLRLPLASMVGLAQEKRPVRGFREALLQGAEGWFSIIAEIKHASPSKGPLMRGRTARELAVLYEACGAQAISVVTEPRFFHGNVEEVALVKEVVGLPVLRKDFIIDEYQVYESAALGADAILLIASVLPDSKLSEFSRLAREINLDVLVEVHDQEDLERALACGANVIGINNRNLRTFEVDLSVTEKLAPLCPREVVVVTESGIRGRADLERLAGKGVRAALVGEVLVTSADPAATLLSLASPFLEGNNGKGGHA